jgi:hypothetical protein
MGFFVVGVRDTGIYGANSSALRRLVVSHAFRALLRVDDINFVAGRDRLVRTFRFASSAVDAFFCDFIGHKSPPDLS